MITWTRLNYFHRDWFPAISTNLVLMNVGKYMRFVATTIDIKVVELSDESVISSRLGCILWVEIYPFVLQSFVLSQVIEVISSFSCIPSKKENTILKCKTMCAWSWCRDFMLIILTSFNVLPNIGLFKMLTKLDLKAYLNQTSKAHLSFIQGQRLQTNKSLNCWRKLCV